MTTPRGIVVLESVPEPQPTTNPYVVMLLDSLRSTSGIEPLTFRWRRALVSHYDVFHVHWPELLVATGGGPKRLVRQLLFVLLMLRLSIRGIPVVQTLHNLAPHETPPRSAAILLRWLRRRTVLAININAVPPSELGVPVCTILHGDYRRWYAPHVQAPLEPGRLAFFGLIRPYKGVEELLHAFDATDDDLRLAIAGSPQTNAMADLLRDRASGDPRIELDLRYLADAELVAHLSRSELVVLPYRTMFNSGGVLAALSLTRPVLVPDNPSNRALAAEVGVEWVRLYRGDLTPGILQREATVVRQLSGSPDLSGRDWHEVGSAHRAAFTRAVAAGSRRRHRGTLTRIAQPFLRRYSR